MPYKKRIKNVAANFPGLMDSDRLDLLNSQLIDLQKQGYNKLVENFLSNKNQYTIRPFLFEIYLCRWLLSQNKIRDVIYEPDDMDRPPEFVFKIDDKIFQIEAKVITQLINETIKKKLVSQINRRISTKTNNVFEIWLSENIESKEINKIVDWIADECTSLTIGNKREFVLEEETVAWIEAIYESKSGGSVIRLIYGKPQHEKPKLGKPPAYITSDVAIPTSHALAKFNALKQAILQGKNGVPMYRRAFLDECIEYADDLRIRERPNVESLGEKVLEDTNKLKSVRDHVVDWVLLESEATSGNDFSEALIEFLERLRELKSRPPELNEWNDVWFEAHSVFVYETFLYIIASLIKTQSFESLHEVFTTHYLLPNSDRQGEDAFDTFDGFYGYSETLQSVLAPEKRKLYSPAAELIKRHADRKDLPFQSIIEAELLVLMMSFLTPDTHWYPQTLHYASYGSVFPLFLRATQHKHFSKLAIVTGMEDANKLRETVKKGHERLGVEHWHNFHYERNFWRAMNMDKLDTLK